MARDAGNKKGDDVSFKSLLARLDENSDRGRAKPAEPPAAPETAPSPERLASPEHPSNPEHRRPVSLAPANDLHRPPAPTGPPGPAVPPGPPGPGMHAPPTIQTGAGHAATGHSPPHPHASGPPPVPPSHVLPPPSLPQISLPQASLQPSPSFARQTPAPAPASGSRVIFWVSIAVGLTVSASLAMLGSMWYARQAGLLDGTAAATIRAGASGAAARSISPDPIRPAADSEAPPTAAPTLAARTTAAPATARDAPPSGRSDAGARSASEDANSESEPAGNVDAPPVPLVPGDTRSARRPAPEETAAARSVQLPSRRLVSESASTPTEAPPATRPPPVAPSVEAKLLVAPTLRARAGEATLYAAKIEAPSLAPDKLRVVITGLPHGAALSAGAAAGEGAWHVPARAIEQLSLRLPSTTGDGFALALELQDSEGRSLARASTVVVALAPPPPPPAPPAAIVPAATPPATVPSPSPPIAVAPTAQPPRLSMDDDTALIERGRLLARNGDIAGARLLFERAADAGSGRAALLLGETYDPDILTGMGVLGARGDIAKARHWYTRASEFGVQQATERLKSLVGR